MNETDPQLKKDNSIFFTPYPVVSFMVRSILIAAAWLVIDEITRKYVKEKAHKFARQYMLKNLYGIEKEMSLYSVCPKKRFIKSPQGKSGLNYSCEGYNGLFHHIGKPMRIMVELLEQ